MAQMIPLFHAEDEENTSSMARQRVFRDLNDPLDCHDELEHVQSFRFSRASISQITELIANHLNFTECSYAAPPTSRFVCHFNLSLLEHSREFVEMGLT